MSRMPRRSTSRHSWAWKTCPRWVRKSLAILMVLLTPTGALTQKAPGPPNWKALFDVVGRTHKIDADLLAAMAEVESGGNPLSVSPSGAVGLMQLMPATAAEFSVLDPFDPVANVIGAADFIDYLRKRFASKLELQGLPVLLAAYNAGPGAVEKYGGIPPYAETHKYVQRVIARYVSGHSARPATAPVLILTPTPYLIEVDPKTHELHSEPVLIDTDSSAATFNQPAIQPASEPVLAAVGTGTAPWIRTPPGLPDRRVRAIATRPRQIFMAGHRHHNRGSKR